MRDAGQRESRGPHAAGESLHDHIRLDQVDLVAAAGRDDVNTVGGREIDVAASIILRGEREPDRRASLGPVGAVCLVAW